jgi:hypothetical protein
MILWRVLVTRYGQDFYVITPRTTTLLTFVKYLTFGFPVCGIYVIPNKLKLSAKTRRCLCLANIQINISVFTGSVVIIIIIPSLPRDIDCYHFNFYIRDVGGGGVA